jgi:hypothetical protein
MNKKEILEKLKKDKFNYEDIEKFFYYNYAILNSVWLELKAKENTTDEEDNIIIAIDCILTFIDYVE